MSIEERSRRTLRVDDSFHRVFRVMEWPRTAVRADWMAGFLCAPDAVRSFTVIFVPQSRRIAKGQATTLATTAAAAVEDRVEHRKYVSAEQRRVQAAANALEEELEQGAGMELFVGLVGVVAPSSEDELESACERTIQAAANCGMELRPVDFRQPAALAAVLPLGRGVTTRRCDEQPETPRRVLRRPAVTGTGTTEGAPPAGTSRHDRAGRLALSLAGRPGPRARVAPLIGTTWPWRAGWFYDPFALYAAGLLDNPNIMVYGEVGSAKSSSVKCLLARQIGLLGRGGIGRQAFIVDPKSEYRGLADALGMRVVPLRPGGDVRVNPLGRMPGSVETTEETLSRRTPPRRGAACPRCSDEPLDPEADAIVGWAMEALTFSDRSQTTRPWSTSPNCSARPPPRWRALRALPPRSSPSGPGWRGRCSTSWCTAT